MRPGFALFTVLLGASCAVVLADPSGPSGAAADPVNTGRVSARDLARLAGERGNLLIVDVRDPGEFRRETIRGAINIPLPELEARLREVPKDTKLVFT